MIDPREIEGSPERAADRGREEDLGFLVSDRPSLGNPDVVRGLVSEFASSIVDVRKRYNQGKLSGEDAKDEIRGWPSSTARSYWARTTASPRCPGTVRAALGVEFSSPRQRLMGWTIPVSSFS